MVEKTYIIDRIYLQHQGLRSVESHGNLHHLARHMMMMMNGCPGFFNVQNLVTLFVGNKCVEITYNNSERKYTSKRGRNEM